MKEEFFGFYSPLSEEVDNSWKEAVFIFDANALLNLYRYSKSTRADFLLVINKLKERLFMPYQVGLEFHNNRLNVIDSLNNSYNLLENGFKEIFENQIKTHLNQFKRHPSIDLISISKIQEEFFKKIVQEFNGQRKNHPDFKGDDEILTQLTELYKGKVGKAFSKTELQKIYDEGKERYAQNIPPGYKDLEPKRKKGDQHVYGDLIIWKEIIAFAKKEKKLVIFVTDDRKEDWWTIENGKTLRPREELIKEFYDLTGTRILLYNTDSFLNYAKERKLVSEIKETSINEVEEIRRVDETNVKISDLINLSNHDWPVPTNIGLSNHLPTSVNSKLQALINPYSDTLRNSTAASLNDLIYSSRNPLSESISSRINEIIPNAHNSLSDSIAGRLREINAFSPSLLSDSVAEKLRQINTFSPSLSAHSVAERLREINAFGPSLLSDSVVERLREINTFKPSLLSDGIAEKSGKIEATYPDSIKAQLREIDSISKNSSSKSNTEKSKGATRPTNPKKDITKSVIDNPKKTLKK